MWFFFTDKLPPAAGIIGNAATTTTTPATDMHQQLLQPNQDALKTFNIQSSSTITSTTVTTSMDGSFVGYNKHHPKNRDSDDSGSCESIDFYQGGMSSDKGHALCDDRRKDIDINEQNKLSSDGGDSMKHYGNYNTNQHNQGRKRRSNRRKNSNNSCNNNNNNSNNNSSSSKSNHFPPTENNTCALNNANYVVENVGPGEFVSGKKRKISSQDVPGPSSHYSANKSPQNPTNDVPMSDFYHSLLESSYSDTTKGTVESHCVTFRWFQVTSFQSLNWFYFSKLMPLSSRSTMIGLN